MQKVYAKSTGNPPSPRVHCDMTRNGASSVLQTRAGIDLDELVNMGKRVITFSIWRPLKTVHRDPLGVVDARTIQPEDLVKMKRTFPSGMVVEVVLSQANGKAGQDCQHKWYWMSEQTEEDVLLIKHYDSAGDGWERGNGSVSCPLHSSFELEGTESTAVRESVEARVAVILG